MKIKNVYVLPSLSEVKNETPMLILKRFRRKQPLSTGERESDLARVLTTLDLTALGIGSTLGVGIYVLAGEVARQTSGPAVVISFFIAAVASMFAAVCYAEFGARVPRAGSAYVYSYVCVGEFVAFIIGWNLILEYVIGTASVSRGYSGYIDSICDGCIARAFEESMPMDVDIFSPYPDFLALGLVLVLSGLLAFGVSESSKFNNVFTVLNLGVVLFTVIAGAIKADASNWNLPKSDLPKLCPNETDPGDGGFTPFGFNGIISGAATCFYGFIGFDCVATTGEEAKNPQRSIPIAIVLSLLFVFASYFGISLIITMLVPYCNQDVNAPLPFAFEQIGWTWAYWIVTIGALFGLSTSLLGSIFPMPRIIYAMASDGLLYSPLCYIHPRTKTPLLATLVAAIISGFMTTLFNLDALIDMMSIGTLMAYGIVAASVVIKRYDYTTLDREDLFLEDEAIQKYSHKYMFKQIINLHRLEYPNKVSSTIVSYVILVMIILMGATSAIIVFLEQEIFHDGEPWALAIFVLGMFFCAACVVIVALQPQSNAKLNFKVPLVPYIPCLSIFINLYLMMQLSGSTWRRFSIWMAVGVFIYLTYGMWFSKLGTKRSSGHDNLGYTSDVERPKKSMSVVRQVSNARQRKSSLYEKNEPKKVSRNSFVIPDILVDLATPHGTPDPKRKLSEPLVSSAFVCGLCLDPTCPACSDKVDTHIRQEMTKEIRDAKSEENVPIVTPKQEDTELSGTLKRHLHSKLTEGMVEDEPSVADAVDSVTAAFEQLHREDSEKDNSNANVKEKAALISEMLERRGINDDANNKSFDAIPPMPTDSPQAKKVADKFVLLPVDVNKNDSDTSSSSDEDTSDDSTASPESPQDDKQEVANSQNYQAVLSEIRNRFSSMSKTPSE